MKQQDAIVLGLAGLAVYLIVKDKGIKLPGFTASAKTPTYDKVTEVLDASGARYSNGWRYFSDGTSIDQLGNYYSGNQLIWTNPAAPNFV